MQVTKLGRVGLDSLRQHASSLSASGITLDALTVYQSAWKADILGRLWQHISNVEIRVDDEYDGIAPFHEEIESIVWELYKGGFTPKEVSVVDEDGDVDSDLCDEAMTLARSAIVDAIYVETENEPN